MRGRRSALPEVSPALDEAASGLSWVPPLAMMLEHIEDQLALLAGQHLAEGRGPLAVGTRVELRGAQGARVHAGGPVLGTVVAVGAGHPLAYSVMWDPLPTLVTSDAWMAGEHLEDEPEPPSTAGDIQDGVPAARIRPVGR